MHNHLKSVLPITGHKFMINNIEGNQWGKFKMSKNFLKSLLKDRDFIYSIKEIRTNYLENITTIDYHFKGTYQPKFLSYCESYWEEVLTLRFLISGKPADESLLRKEYFNLTGVRFQDER